MVAIVNTEKSVTFIENNLRKNQKKMKTNSEGGVSYLYPHGLFIHARFQGVLSISITTL